MEQIAAFIQEALQADAYKFVLSGATEKASVFRKFTFSLRDGRWYCEKLTDKQAFHSRADTESLPGMLAELFASYTQMNAWAQTIEYTARRTKKGKLLITRKAMTNTPAQNTGHNAEKQYLIKEGTIVPPLVDMGVMTPDGKVVKAMYHKFRQINRYLEIIDDVLKDHGNAPLHMVDFGCGKSYLTFVVYYYFAIMRGLPVTMAGIDLKEDVIDFCNAVAAKYNYAGLIFVKGDIAAYKSERPVGMVISLHACDTATDYVLYNALCWNARYILSVPCCHHEVASQISLDALPVFSRHGILKERFSTLVTDALRADILSAYGYKTQLMEFVDLTHTPKNILIRAVRANPPMATRQAAASRVRETCEQFKINPTFVRLVQESGLSSETTE